MPGWCSLYSFLCFWVDIGNELLLLLVLQGEIGEVGLPGADGLQVSNSTSNSYYVLISSGFKTNHQMRVFLVYGVWITPFTMPNCCLYPVLCSVPVGGIIKHVMKCSHNCSRTGEIIRAKFSIDQLVKCTSRY